MRTAWPRGKHVFVSGSATSEAVARAVNPSHLAGARVGHDGASLEELKEALAHLSLAWYGRDGALDEPTLDDALAIGRRLQRRLARQHTWLAQRLAALKRASTGRGVKVWAR